MPRARAARAVVEGLPGVVRAQLFGDALHVTVASPAESREAQTALAAGLAAAGHPVTAIAPIAPALEDVFLARIAEAE